jgi:hypothetical protein
MMSGDTGYEDTGALVVPVTRRGVTNMRLLHFSGVDVSPLQLIRALGSHGLSPKAHLLPRRWAGEG